MYSLEECIASGFTYNKISENLKIGFYVAKSKVSEYFNHQVDKIKDYESFAKNKLREIQVTSANNRALREKKKRNYKSFISIKVFRDVISKDLTATDIEYINWCIENYDTSVVNNWRFVEFVAQQITYYEEADDKVHNLNIFVKRLNRWRGAEEEIWLLRYGAKLGEIKYKDYLISIDTRTGKSDEEIADIRSKTAKTLKSNYSKMSKEEIIARQLTNLPPYWIARGYSVDDAIKKAAEYDRVRAASAYAACTSDEYKLAHRNFSRRCIEFWQNKGFSYDESLDLVSNEQRRDLAYYISIYGEEEGLIRHNNRTANWLATMDAKSDEEKYEILKKKIVPFGKASKRSLIFFDRLIAELYNESIITLDDYHIGVGDKTEYLIRDSITNKVRMYDFCIPRLKIIVEFNGLCFHCDPDTLDISDNPFELNPMEVYARDLYKRQLAERNGFEVLYVIEDKKGQYANEIKRIVDRIRVLHIGYPELS
jgi:hypothetical protein